jgi:hypothetical protein
MRRQKSVYQGWKGTSGLLGYLDIIRCLVGPCGGVWDSFRSGFIGTHLMHNEQTHHYVSYNERILDVNKYHQIFLKFYRDLF